MKTENKMPFEKMVDLRRKLAAGMHPEALLKFAQPYGYDLEDLKGIQADAKAHGAAFIRIGGAVTINT
jgi:hypothetical protein